MHASQCRRKDSWTRSKRTGVSQTCVIVSTILETRYMSDARSIAYTMDFKYSHRMGWNYIRLKISSFANPSQNAYYTIWNWWCIMPAHFWWNIQAPHHSEARCIGVLLESKPWNPATPLLNKCDRYSHRGVEVASKDQLGVYINKVIRK